MNTTLTIEMEEQFIGKHMIKWNAQLIGNWLNDTVKAARYKINRFICFTQAVNKFSEKKTDRESQTLNISSSNKAKINQKQEKFQ